MEFLMIVVMKTRKRHKKIQSLRSSYEKDWKTWWNEVYSEVTTLIDDMSISILPKLRGQSQKWQTQIVRYASPNTKLFHYFNANNREELARMIFVEHLSFSFGKKVDFVNYCQQVLKSFAYRVPKTTLTHIFWSL